MAIPTLRPKRSAWMKLASQIIRITVYRFIAAYNWTTEKEACNNSTDGICSVTSTEELGILSRDYQLTVSISIEWMRGRHASTGWSNQLSQFFEPWTEL
jgi:hypothetical protein